MTHYHSPDSLFAFKVCLDFMARVMHSQINRHGDDRGHSRACPHHQTTIVVFMYSDKKVRYGALQPNRHSWMKSTSCQGFSRIHVAVDASESQTTALFGMVTTCYPLLDRDTLMNSFSWNLGDES